MSAKFENLFPLLALITSGFVLQANAEPENEVIGADAPVVVEGDSFFDFPRSPGASTVEKGKNRVQSRKTRTYTMRLSPGEALFAIIALTKAGGLNSDSGSRSGRNSYGKKLKLEESFAIEGVRGNASTVVDSISDHGRRPRLVEIESVE